MATAPSAYSIKLSAFLRNVLFTAFQRQDKHCRHLKQKRKIFLSAVYIVTIYPKFEYYQLHAIAVLCLTDGRSIGPSYTIGRLRKSGGQKIDIISLLLNKLS